MYLATNNQRGQVMYFILKEEILRNLNIDTMKEVQLKTLFMSLGLRYYPHSTNQ